MKFSVPGTPETNGAISAVAEVVHPRRWIQLTSYVRGQTSGGFGTNLLLMLVGTALGQAASVLLSPALTRIYTPDQFGYLGVYAAVLTILGVVAALGIDQAIPIASSIDELANLLASSAIALACTTIVVSLAVWLLPDSLFGALWLSPLASYRILVPIGFACVGGYYVMVAAATRLSAFRHIAWTRISQGLSGPIAQIVLGLSGAGAPGLAIGFIVGQSSGTGMILSQVLMAEPRLGPSVSWRGIWGVMLRYAKFPLFASWSRILEMAGSGSVLFLVFSAFYSPEIAGYMFLTERVIARPLLIVSTSLLQVFTGEAGQAVLREPARLRRRFWQVLPRQFVLAAGWIGLANLAAGWSFPALFGPAMGRGHPIPARIERVLPRADSAASGVHAAADHGAAGHGSDMAGRPADPRDRQRDRRGAARMVGIDGAVAQCVGPGGRVHHYAGLDRDVGTKVQATMSRALEGCFSE